MNVNNGIEDNKTQLSKFDLSDILLKYLEEIGVEFIFGVPGGAIEPLYNAIARSQKESSPKAIIARHENGAAFMADGYYRETNNLGVCCTTTGPGATNLITAVASAKENKIPLLVLTGQSMLNKFGSKSLQESSCTGVDTVALFKHVTKYSSLISHPNQFEKKVSQAIMQALTPPYGPAHLSIPLDIFRVPSKLQCPTYKLKELISSLSPRSLFDYEDVDCLNHFLKAHDKKLFIIGEDATDNVEEIYKLANIHDAYIVSTPHAKGALALDESRFLGVLGFAGHKSALQIIHSRQVENIVIFGSCMSEWSISGWEDILMEKNVVLISQTVDDLLNVPMVNKHITANLSGFVSSLLKLSESVVKKSSASRIESYEIEDIRNKDVHPVKLFEWFGTSAPRNTGFYVDPGNGLAWAIQHLNLKQFKNKDKDYFNSTLEFASMGWSIGASVGAAVACKHRGENRKIVCICGDGSYLMSGQEINTAITENLNMVFVVLNDSALGMVKHGQRLANAESIGWEMPNTNYAQMAKAMGAHGVEVKNENDLTQELFDTILNLEGTVLVDVRIDSEAVPPMKQRLKILGTL